MGTKIWGHFKTITKHKILVMISCFRIGLYRQGLMHDLSKYTPSEFIPGCRYYQGYRSPNSGEREDTGVSLAWLHHKGRNKHHLEYWIDFGLPPCPAMIKGVPMPKKYVAEMIMDRIAASKIYNGKTYTDQHPLQYFYGVKDRMWYVHETTLDQMDMLLTMCAEKGENATFSYIKNVFLKEDS